MCATSRFVLPAILAGMVVATLANQAVLGWVSGAVVAGLLFLMGRRGGTSCAMPSRSLGQTAAESDAEPGAHRQPSGAGQR